jgi:hypothetical protein
LSKRRVKLAIESELEYVDSDGVNSGDEVLDLMFEGKLSTCLRLNSKVSGRSTGGFEAGSTLNKLEVVTFVPWHPKREDLGLSSGQLPNPVL